MKFTLITNDIYSVLNFRFDLLNTIQEKGSVVYIFAPNIYEEPEVSQILKEKGFILIPIFMDRAGTNPIADFRTIFSIFRQLKKIKPDIVFSYTIKPVIYGSIAAFMVGIRNINALICGLGNMFHDGAESKFSVVGNIVNTLYTFALNKCKTVFFQNPDDLDLLSRFRILKDTNKSVLVNGSGINLEKFPITSLKLTETGKPKPSFIMVARLLRYKGVCEFVEAARILHDKYPHSEFHLVGGCDENPASISESELNEWSSSKFIKCWGRLSDVRPALKEANVFVLPSYYREGVPRSILEAMSMGKVIVTTDNVGCRETVEIGKNGLLVEPKNVDSLVAALETLILKPEFMLDMSSYSRFLAEQKYDVRKVNESMIRCML